MKFIQTLKKYSVRLNLKSDSNFFQEKKKLLNLCEQEKFFATIQFVESYSMFGG